MSKNVFILQPTCDDSLMRLREKTEQIFVRNEEEKFRDLIVIGFIDD